MRAPCHCQSPGLRRRQVAWLLVGAGVGRPLLGRGLGSSASAAALLPDGSPDPAITPEQGLALYDEAMRAASPSMAIRAGSASGRAWSTSWHRV